LVYNGGSGHTRGRTMASTLFPDQESGGSKGDNHIKTGPDIRPGMSLRDPA
jgi:hypothetical protein